MKQIDSLHLLKTLLRGGYDVAYVDADKDRLEAAVIMARKLKRRLPIKMPLIWSGTPVATSTHHRDITVCVNPENILCCDWINVGNAHIRVYI